MVRGPSKISTVLMGGKKAILLKIHYFYVLKSLLGQKFHTNFKNDLKKFHTIPEGHNFLIELQLQF